MGGMDYSLAIDLDRDFDDVVQATRAALAERMLRMSSISRPSSAVLPVGPNSPYQTRMVGSPCSTTNR